MNPHLLGARVRALPLPIDIMHGLAVLTGEPAVTNSRAKRRSLHAALKALQDDRCFWCSHRMTVDCCDTCATHLARLRCELWNLDHVRPTNRGGTDTLDNIVRACWPCNISKSSRSLRLFLRAAGLENREYRHPVTGLLLHRGGAR